MYIQLRFYVEQMARGYDLTAGCACRFINVQYQRQSVEQVFWVIVPDLLVHDYYTLVIRPRDGPATG